MTNDEVEALFELGVHQHELNQLKRLEPRDKDKCQIPYEQLRAGRLDFVKRALEFSYFKEKKEARRNRVERMRKQLGE